ncbi:MAG: hypothetical protein ABSA72_11790, partial [Nitrososphaerales archaeon]
AGRWRRNGVRPPATRGDGRGRQSVAQGRTGGPETRIPDRRSVVHGRNDRRARATCQPTAFPGATSTRTGASRWTR